MILKIAIIKALELGYIAMVQGENLLVLAFGSTQHYSK
jgi:hypothetical protein